MLPKMGKMKCIYYSYSCTSNPFKAKFGTHVEYILAKLLAKFLRKWMSFGGEISKWVKDQGYTVFSVFLFVALQLHINAHFVHTNEYLMHISVHYMVSMCTNVHQLAPMCISLH